MSKLLLALLSTTVAVSHAATVTYHWTITNTTERLDGVLRYSLGINNNPGYQTPIEVNTGDTVIVKVTNGLTVPTSLHWHGLLQVGTNHMDGPTGATQCAIAPGDQFTYQFSTGNQEGTYWWHGHFKAQYIDGLRGPFIIRNPSSKPVLPYDDDQTIQLADWYHEQSDNLLAWYLDGDKNPDGNEPVFNSGLINGRGQFDCKFTKMDCQTRRPASITVVPGKTTRLRIINTAGFAGFQFSIDGHSLTVIEVDGVNTQPYKVDSISLNIAQRYSVLVTADQTVSNYWIRATMFSGAPWTSAPDPDGLNKNVLAVLSYQGADVKKSPTSSAQSNPVILDDNQLQPIPSLTPPPLTSNDLNMLFSFDFDRLNETQAPGGIADKYQKAYPTIYLPSQNITLAYPTIYLPSQNITLGTSYVQPQVPTLVSVGSNKVSVNSLPSTSNAVPIKIGQVVQLILVNDDGGEHPFHLHGHVFWVMASGIATKMSDVPNSFSNSNPLRRDTVTVPACPSDDNGCLNATDGSGSQFGYTIIRFVADNPGVWLFHCHIEWHIAAGLVMTFVEGADQIQQKGLPASTMQTCSTLDSWVKQSGYPMNIVGA
ncbi:ferroxidase fet3 [Blyttiomyces sp. JEL0837]|nr:ferroxidase fet3 [Blyttiomyces sp. JEL0837]